MAVLAEAINVVIKDSTIKNKFIGGIDKFRKIIPNNTHCADGEIHRIGFMTPQDTELFVLRLEKLGLVFIDSGKFIDIAVIDMLFGPTARCDWLGFARQNFFQNRAVYKKSNEDFSIVWLLPLNGVYGIPIDSNSEFRLAVPEGWTPDKALYKDNFIPNEKIRDRLIELGNENGFVKYWYAENGEIVYTGRPKIL